MKLKITGRDFMSLDIEFAGIANDIYSIGDGVIGIDCGNHMAFRLTLTEPEIKNLIKALQEKQQTKS